MCDLIAIVIIVVVIIYIIICTMQNEGRSVSRIQLEEKKIIEDELKSRAMEKAKREKEREEKEKEERRIKDLKLGYAHAISGYKNSLYYFFQNNCGLSYETMYQQLMRQVEVMEEYNAKLPQDSKFAEGQIATYMNCANEFREFGIRVDKKITDWMIKSSNYGNAVPEYLRYIQGMKKQDVDATINYIQNILDKQEYGKLWRVDITEVMSCLWFCAMHKPYSALDFERAQNLFYAIYKKPNIEVVIAEAYAIRQIGGAEVLRNKIKQVLDNDLDKYASNSGIADVLTKLASGLMWMQAYKEEYMVLQYMLENKIQMSAKLQERLHSLSNGGGNAPSVYDVTSNTGKMYLDVAALAWRDEDYSRFFENLSFQEKSLTYSLAVRDEDKELFITQAVNFPDSSSVIGKLETVFRREYGMGVSAANIECVALSGNGSETMKGILVRTKECEQLGIFVHIGRIGKKLNIKFYTLFIPKGQNIDVQKQQVISMYKKLSPTVSMWESSLKDTILMAMQQLLNQTPASPGGDPNGQRTEQVEF